MKKPGYTLEVKDPCNEDWNAMSTTDNGRFCLHCQHSVIDFTNLTDNEVLNIVERSNGKLCGRFRPEQLNRLMVQTANANTNPALYKILAGLLLLSTTNMASAQQATTGKTATVQTNQYIVGDMIAVNNIQPKNTKVENNVIHGQVLYAGSKNPSPNAEIKIIGTQIHAQTDSNGNFQLVVPDSLLKDKILVQAYLHGFMAAHISISPNELSNNQVLFLNRNTVMGRLAAPERNPQNK